MVSELLENKIDELIKVLRKIGDLKQIQDDIKEIKKQLSNNVTDIKEIREQLSNHVTDTDKKIDALLKHFGIL